MKSGSYIRSHSTTVKSIVWFGGTLKCVGIQAQRFAFKNGLTLKESFKIYLKIFTLGISVRIFFFLKCRVILVM